MKNDPYFASIMSRAGQCDPGDDKDVVALQMADLLAWEFSKHVETQVMSEAFNVIREKNQIMYLPCRPPRQFSDTLKLQKLAKEVHAETTEFLKQIREPRSHFSSAEEVAARANELKMREAYFNLEWGRYLLQLDADEDFQNFRNKFLATRGDDDEFSGDFLRGIEPEDI